MPEYYYGPLKKMLLVLKEVWDQEAKSGLSPTLFDTVPHPNHEHIPLLYTSNPQASDLFKDCQRRLGAWTIAITEASSPPLSKPGTSPLYLG